MTHTVSGSNVTRTAPGDVGALITLAADGAGTVIGTHQENLGGRGVEIGINISAISGTSPSLTVKVFGVDQASGQSYLILSSAALTAVGFTLLTIFPGAPVTANASANAELPAKWFVETVVAGTGPSVTATGGASILA
jgi:hypothetical protein